MENPGLRFKQIVNVSECSVIGVTFTIFMKRDSLFAYNYFSPKRIFADFGYVIKLKIALPTISNT